MTFARCLGSGSSGQEQLGLARCLGMEGLGRRTAPLVKERDRGPHPSRNQEVGARAHLNWLHRSSVLERELVSVMAPMGARRVCRTSSFASRREKFLGHSRDDDLAVQLRVFNLCESKTSVTSAEIAWLRKARCVKEVQQKKKSEAEFAKWELAKMRINIVDAKAQVKAAGCTAVFSAASPGRA